MSERSAFETRFGFPRRDVRLGNWRRAPYSRWSFQNVSELVPSAFVARGDAPWELPRRPEAPLMDVALELPAGRETVRRFLERSFTDALLVLHDGTVLLEHHAEHADPGSRHLVFSISKSVTGVLCGALEADGALDPDAPVVRYLPQARGGAFGACSVRQLLDMRVALAFDEDYEDPHGEFARYRRAMLWNPPHHDAPQETLPEFLLSLRPGEERDGNPFHYASPCTDMLGLVLEGATGERFADLMSRRLWGPLGATRDALVTVGVCGTARAAGGVACSAYDLALLGEALRNGGTRCGERVVPSAWVDDMRRNGDPDAWRAGAFSSFMPSARYRSQWYQLGNENDAFCAIGIHGQWLYVDPVAKAVIVKLSSQPDPLERVLDRDSLAFLQGVSRLL